MSEERLAKLEAHIRDLAEDVQEMKGDVKALQEDIQRLSEDIAALKTAIKGDGVRSLQEQIKDNANGLAQVRIELAKVKVWASVLALAISAFISGVIGAFFKIFGGK